MASDADSQWLLIQSFLLTCSGLCVSNETRCRRFVEACAGWRTRISIGGLAYGKWKSVYRSYADGYNQDVWPRLMAYMQADLDLSDVWAGQHG